MLPLETKTNKVQVNAAPAAQEGYLKTWFLRYYKAATLASCFLLILAGYFLILGPKISSMNETIGVALGNEKQKKMNLEEKLGYLAKLAAKREQFTGADIARVDDILPTDPSLPELFSMIDWLGRDSGVSIGSINISQSSASSKNKSAVKTAAEKSLPEGVKPIEVGLSVSADNYSKLKTFLYNIERSSRIMDAVALNYNPSGTSYTVTVRVYYQPKKTAADMAPTTDSTQPTPAAVPPSEQPASAAN